MLSAKMTLAHQKVVAQALELQTVIRTKDGHNKITEKATTVSFFLLSKCVS